MSIAVHHTIDHDSDAPRWLEYRCMPACTCPSSCPAFHLSMPLADASRLRRMNMNCLSARIIDAHFRQVCMNCPRGKPVTSHIAVEVKTTSANARDAAFIAAKNRHYNTITT
ncbi:hypothetical protein KQ945_11485 [Bacillus subtilis subsp. subtilis]|nr:hypothetical protein [Bacillus subtilis subsp. subtilis]